MRIPMVVLDAVRHAAEAAYPYEACGFLAGEAVANGEVVVRRRVSAENRCLAEGSARNRYELSPSDFLVAERTLGTEGLEIVGIYHSHPDAPARPSTYDRELAWPWYRYLIMSVVQGVAREARAWQLTDDRREFVEDTVTVEERATCL